MNALQMKYEFEIGYELANLSSRGYSNKEISTLLSQAQTSVVLDIMESDDSELKDILINNLKVPYSASTNTYSYYPNAVKAAMPNDMLKNLQELVEITFNAKSPYYSLHKLSDVSVFTITEDYYNANIENPDKKPYYKLVWRLLTPSYIVLIGDETYTPTTYKCIYVKRPSPIIIKDSSYTSGDGQIDDEYWSGYTNSSLDCDLEEIFHRKIVDKAIILAIEPTGDTQRLQTKVSIT